MFENLIWAFVFITLFILCFLLAYIIYLVGFLPLYHGFRLQHRIRSGKACDLERAFNELMDVLIHTKRLKRVRRYFHFYFCVSVVTDAHEYEITHDPWGKIWMLHISRSTITGSDPENLYFSTEPRSLSKLGLFGGNGWGDPSINPTNEAGWEANVGGKENLCELEAACVSVIGDLCSVLNP